MKSLYHDCHISHHLPTPTVFSAMCVLYPFLHQLQERTLTQFFLQINPAAARAMEQTTDPQCGRPNEDDWSVIFLRATLSTSEAACTSVRYEIQKVPVLFQNGKLDRKDSLPGSNPVVQICFAIHQPFRLYTRTTKQWTERQVLQQLLVMDYQGHSTQ